MDPRQCFEAVLEDLTDFFFCKHLEKLGEMQKLHNEIVAEYRKEQAKILEPAFDAAMKSWYKKDWTLKVKNRLRTNMHKINYATRTIEVHKSYLTYKVPSYIDKKDIDSFVDFIKHLSFLIEYKY